MCIDVHRAVWEFIIKFLVRWALCLFMLHMEIMKSRKVKPKVL